MAKKEKQVEKFDEFYLENMLYYTRVPDSYKNRQIYKPINDKILRAFIPGTIREMGIKVGDTVQKGDQLMILDAMKMNNVVRSFFDGKVKSIFIKDGDMVKKNQEIVEFE